jgi:outer membrane protein TolC
MHLPPFLGKAVLLTAAATAAVVAAGCRSPEAFAAEADAEVDAILSRATARATGQAKLVPVERPAATLRKAIEAGGRIDEPLSLVACLDVAAENSREFQRQKETLYLTALSLTRARYDFSWQFGAGATAEVEGVGDDTAQASLAEDLRASWNTPSGPRIVASFVNNLLRSLVGGGGWDTGSLLNLSFTQPLLRASNPAIVREPLTQAERDVIYQVRDYERFRTTFAVRVVSEYYRVLEQVENLKTEEANYASLKRSRQRIEAMAEAGRQTSIDVDRARQNEFAAENRNVDARTRLGTSLDRFLITLGLPTDAAVTLEQADLTRLRQAGVELVDLEEERAIAIAMDRRLDYRNVRDEVEDAVRRARVTEDALRSTLDFGGAITVPTEPDKALVFDWSQVRWSAGFDLELAVSKLPERNAFRTALINLDFAIRAREQIEDEIKRDVREALRAMQRAYQTHVIQARAVELAVRRVESTRDFFEAGDRGTTTLDVLDAQESLLQAQLAELGALVDYAIARLQLLRELDALALEPSGLRFDSTLPIPPEPLPSGDASPETDEGPPR